MIVTYMHQLEDDDEQQQSDQQRFDGRETANSQESEAGAQTIIMTQTEELVSLSIENQEC